MKSSNIFENIPKNIKNEFFETILDKNNLKIERIVSKGHTSPEAGWYDQTQDEWVIVLQGAATLTFENGEPVGLEAGSYLNIPAHTKHKVSWADPQVETVWLSIYY
ncbi:MAG: cupin domain-containing protein [Ghiorsea sp.]